MLYGNKGESQGNQVFADLLPHLIRVIENAGMLIIDEFGNSLHNKLAEKIIEFFMENVASVSYTHLDVYKRQSKGKEYLNVLDFIGNYEKAGRVRSVSYTHLRREMGKADV